MLYCKHCKVSLPGAPVHCPLCQGRLSGEPEENRRTFPPFAAQTALIRQILAWGAFGAVAASVISFAINLILPSGGWWWLFVMGGLASLWAAVYLVLQKRRNIPKTILWQAAVVSFLAFLWDHFTGFRGWSLDYVLPILCTCSMVSVFVIARVRRLHIQDYMLYLVLVCILGIVSFVLLMAGVLNVSIPAAICFAASVICVARILIFQGKTLWAEIQRRLHL